MTMLNQAGREFVTFDPSNDEHRKIFHSVIATQNWGRSPVRFWSDSEHTDLMYQCTAKLARWYMGKEFGKIEA